MKREFAGHIRGRKCIILRIKECVNVKSDLGALGRLPGNRDAQDNEVADKQVERGCK